MRTLKPWLSITPRKAFPSAILLAVAIGISAFFAQVHNAYVLVLDEKGDLGAFIELLPEDSPPALAVPIPSAPLRDAKLSDGKFEMLSPKWKQGVTQVIASGRCDRFDMIFAITGGDNIGFLMTKAQALVESNCEMLGTDGALQVKAIACEDVTVLGDRTDPFVNALCAAEYRKALCMRYDSCASLAELFVAYNRGPTGAAKVANYEATEYARKIDFALRALIKAAL